MIGGSRLENLRPFFLQVCSVRKFQCGALLHLMTDLLVCILAAETLPLKELVPCNFESKSENCEKNWEAKLYICGDITKLSLACYFEKRNVHNNNKKTSDYVK